MDCPDDPTHPAGARGTVNDKRVSDVRIRRPESWMHVNMDHDNARVFVVHITVSNTTLALQAAERMRDAIDQGTCEIGMQLANH